MMQLNQKQAMKPIVPVTIKNVNDIMDMYPVYNIMGATPCISISVILYHREYSTR
jgi:hypothetical protein